MKAFLTREINTCLIIIYFLQIIIKTLSLIKRVFYINTIKIKGETIIFILLYIFRRIDTGPTMVGIKILPDIIKVGILVKDGLTNKWAVISIIKRYFSRKLLSSESDPF